MVAAGMLVAFDIDGTIDAEPSVMQSLMTALQSAGHRVVVLSGTSDEKVEPSEVEDKTEYLQSLGCANCYDALVIVTHPVDDNKAEWLKTNCADLLVDNDKGNAKAAAGICPVLVPWANRK